MVFFIKKNYTILYTNQGSILSHVLSLKLSKVEHWKRSEQWECRGNSRGRGWALEEGWVGWGSDVWKRKGHIEKALSSQMAVLWGSFLASGTYRALEQGVVGHVSGSVKSALLTLLRAWEITRDQGLRLKSAALFNAILTQPGRLTSADLSCLI